MLSFVAGLLLFGALFLVIICFVLLLPPKQPVNIPAIPFWVALIPLFKDVDQADIFRRYIEEPVRRHGAVKLFFGARWNLLVHKPAYLAEVFKEEDVYQKSGNQKKIPHSVLAEFLGDNIISSYGAVWRNYRAVVTPGLQKKFEGGRIAANAKRLCELLRAAQLRAGAGGVAVQELLQRYSVANCSEVLLQTELDASLWRRDGACRCNSLLICTQALGSANAPINVLQSAVKREIFRPIFMNFPFLDRLPLPGRTRARMSVRQFKTELKGAVIKSQQNSGFTAQYPNGLSQRMLLALKSGRWSDKQLEDNLTVTFVAGQENPQLCMISTLYLLAKNPVCNATC